MHIPPDGCDPRSTHYSLAPKSLSARVPWWIAWPAIFVGIAYVLYNGGVLRPSRTEDAKWAAAEQDVLVLSGAIEAMKADIGRYPTTTEGLAALSVDPGHIANWRGPYLGKPIASDPWGRPYIYRFPGTHRVDSFDLFSAGHDRVPGSADDIGRR